MNIIYLSYIIALCTIVAKCYCLLICSNVCLDKDLLGESCNYWRRSHIDSCKIHENVIEDFICEQRWFMIYSDISQALTSQPQHEFRAAKEPNVNWSAITAIIKELSKIARKRSKSKNYPDVLQLVMDKTIRYGSEEEEEEERERLNPRSIMPSSTSGGNERKDIPSLIARDWICRNLIYRVSRCRGIPRTDAPDRPTAQKIVSMTPN